MWAQGKIGMRHIRAAQYVKRWCAGTWHPTVGIQVVCCELFS